MVRAGSSRPTSSRESGSLRLSALPVGQSSGMIGDVNDYDDVPLSPSESLDSDEVRNDDGDEVVDPPAEWIEATEHESLDERLAEEVPDVTPEYEVSMDSHD